NQMDKFVHQLEEMRDLTTKIIQDANPAKTDIGPVPTGRNNASTTTSSSSARSYPSSGGYTPGGPRGYSSRGGDAQRQTVHAGSWLMSWKALWMAPPQPSRIA